MRRNSCSVYNLVVHRLLRLLEKGGTDPALCRRLFGTFGGWYASCWKEAREKPGSAPRVLTPTSAARLRCNLVIKSAESFADRSPSDLGLLVGYFIDCHIPLLEAGVGSVCAVYRSNLAPEQPRSTEYPIAIGQPFKSRSVTEHDLGLAWFSPSKSQNQSPLIKLLSKGCRAVKTIRYIGPQCVRCAQSGGKTFAVVRELIIAGQLGAYSHRLWNGAVFDIDKRMAIYRGGAVAELPGTVGTYSAKMLHGFVSEYLVGVTRLFPPIWRAVNCMVGGHMYISHVLSKCEMGIKATKRRRGPAVSVAPKRQKMQAIELPPKKLSTALLVNTGVAPVVQVILGGERPDGMPVSQYHEVRCVTSIMRSGLKVALLPAAVEAQQRAAAERHLGCSSVPLAYCAACTVIQGKVQSKMRRPSKRRLGPLVVLGEQPLESAQCSTCKTVGWMRVCNLVGRELHARVHSAHDFVAVTLCVGCGLPGPNYTYGNLGPTCAACLEKGPSALVRRTCICGCSKTNVGGVDFAVCGPGRQRGETLWVCAKHKAGLQKLPLRAEYTLEAVLDAISGAAQPTTYASRRVYLK